MGWHNMQIERLRSLRAFVLGAVVAVVSMAAVGAEWRVEKEPLGPGYQVVRQGDPNTAPIKVDSKEAADAVADVLNEFEKKKERRDRRGQ